ncbi:TSUP family transporter [Streptomyces sp. NPDC003327]
MGIETALLGFATGLVLAAVTAPVGVSGAVFLLPVQVSVLGVPSPAVTPTNLLYNVVAGPGALLRHRRTGALGGPLTRLLLLGTVPGVVLGALIRAWAVPGAVVFRLFVAALLLPLGLWLCLRTLRPARPATGHVTGRAGRVTGHVTGRVTGPPTSPVTSPVTGAQVGPPEADRATETALTTGAAGPSRRATAWLALGVGAVGGVYGIGGGSLIGPVLVGRGLPVATVAPAALAATFVTSVVGAVAYGLLALVGGAHLAPDWSLGLSCGLGGLVGGHLGARLQPRLPEAALRLLLGATAAGVGAFYAAQVLA